MPVSPVPFLHRSPNSPLLLLPTPIQHLGRRQTAYAMPISFPRTSRPPSTINHTTQVPKAASLPACSLLLPHPRPSKASADRGRWRKRTQDHQDNQKNEINESSPPHDAVGDAHHAPFGFEKDPVPFRKSPSVHPTASKNRHLPTVISFPRQNPIVHHRTCCSLLWCFNSIRHPPSECGFVFFCVCEPKATPPDPFRPIPSKF